MKVLFFFKGAFYKPSSKVKGRQKTHLLKINIWLHTKESFLRIINCFILGSFNFSRTTFYLFFYISFV